MGLRTLPRNLWQLGRGVMAARRILRQFKPDVLFFTGGYVAVPMALAGVQVPSLLYVPDIEPGLALKTLARFADRIAVTRGSLETIFQQARAAAPDRLPHPPRISANGPARKPTQALNLNEEFPVLLVSGGSKGARSINNAVLAKACRHCSNACRWSTSPVNWIGRKWKRRRRISAKSRLPVTMPIPYLHEEMGAALTAADLVISRAGASSTGRVSAVWPARRSWCPTRMPGATRRSMRNTWCEHGAA